MPSASSETRAAAAAATTAAAAPTSAHATRNPGTVLPASTLSDLPFGSDAITGLLSTTQVGWCRLTLSSPC